MLFAHFFLFPVKTTPPLSALCMGTEGAEQQEGFSALLRVGPGTPPKYTHTFPPPPAQHPGRLPSALQSQGQCSGAASAWPSTGSEDGEMPWHCSQHSQRAALGGREEGRDLGLERGNACTILFSQRFHYHNFFILVLKDNPSPPGNAEPFHQGCCSAPTLPPPASKGSSTDSQSFTRGGSCVFVPAAPSHYAGSMEPTLLRQSPTCIQQRPAGHFSWEKFKLDQ